MARIGPGSPHSRGNIKLDSFLRRNTDQAVYERIRSYEPCVVVSETINKAYMHVVLSDELVFLTEYAPRTLTAALSFRRVRDIKLVNDLPDFLRGKHRELCQHIRITYVTEEPVRRRALWSSKGQRSPLPPAEPPSRRTSHCPPTTRTFEGDRTQRNYNEIEIRLLASAHSKTLSLIRVPQPPSLLPLQLSSPADSHTSPLSPPNPRSSLPQRDQVPRRIRSVLSRLLKRDYVCSGEEREAELHLYAVSRASRLYLHLQSSWNSFIIRSTLLLDPLYRGRCRALSDSSPGKQLPVVSRERTAHLLAQLSCELLQEGVSVERLYLLLQELRTAAHRSAALCRLFWKSRDIFVFLVQTLEESLHGCQSKHGEYTADQLLLSTLTVQTLAIMFRGTEGEPARLDLLSAEKGALASRLLLVLICDPEIQNQERDCEVSYLLFISVVFLTPFLIFFLLQALLQEYLDASCSLLFELLLLGQEASTYSFADNFLSVGWILRVVQPHPHLLSFLGYQVKQMVLVLSDLEDSSPSPAESVLLYQRCRLLLACLQYNNQLSQHLRSKFREEFRYFLKPSCAEEKLPPHYPISQPTVRLIEELISLNR
ncbi:uncharacterized protein C12orf56 homolog isoform X1 [Takifugu flavidus]|uniref:uncharacterized protein C12orf56 homolog isoform X1 n=1 Tax=Takifugu flavidus TaxID=433684 RepID=UPI00254444EC|nr:uncharacterized protein C12orf56 homolog isoform X1 [Takifugu flavidus]